MGHFHRIWKHSLDEGTSRPCCFLHTSSIPLPYLFHTSSIPLVPTPFHTLLQACPELCKGHETRSHHLIIRESLSHRLRRQFFHTSSIPLPYLFHTSSIPLPYLLYQSLSIHCSRHALNYARVLSSSNRSAPSFDRTISGLRWGEVLMTNGVDSPGTRVNMP